MKDENNKIKDEIKEKDKKYQKLLYKRNYHKFKKGPIFYMFSTGDNLVKVGYDDIDINTRLEAHRTTYPSLKLHYLCFTPHAKLLETNMLIRFEKKKLMLNHEVILDVPINTLIESANTFITFCDFPATIESQEDLDKYNE